MRSSSPTRGGRSAGIRVLIDPRVADRPPPTGDWRVWSNVSQRLGAHVELVETRPDVVLLDGHLPPFTERRPTVPVVFEADFDNAETSGFNDPPHLYVEKDSRTRLNVENATRVITLSHASRDQIARRYAVEPTRVDVHYLGVDHAVFSPSNNAASATTAMVTALKPFVLAVSSPHPRKNLQSLREAMARLRASGDDHILVMVVDDTHGFPGAARLAQEITEDLPSDPNSVRRIVSPDDSTLSLLMREAAAVCFPSLMEGFGLPLLEAMASGAACVVSRRGSLPEIGGEACAVTEPTPGGLADAISRVVRSERSQSVLRATAIVRARSFSWELTAAGWAASLQAAVDLSSPW